MGINLLKIFINSFVKANFIRFHAIDQDISSPGKEFSKKKYIEQDFTFLNE